MPNEPTTILYIDDDPDDLMIFGESINSLYPDVRILKAQSGEEGINILSMLEEENLPYPSLVMLDLNMPKMNGRQTLEHIRSRQGWEDIPVVIFTTCSSASDIEFCKNYNTECITKPMSYKYMSQTIQQLFTYCNISLDEQRANG
jgi:CheY-like chemotaxis protein